MKRKNDSHPSRPGVVVLLISAILIGLLALGIVFFLTGCESQKEEPKYVFVFLGDGMGINQVTATRYWEAQEQGQPVGKSIWKESSFDSFPVTGMMSTHNMNLSVTDSAASATALFTGEKTQNGSLNYNPETRESYVPFAKKLSDNGYAVGIISTTSLNHASPAALYANAEDRYDYDGIADQGVSCGWLDFWAAGGFHGEEDAHFEAAQKEGFSVIRTRSELEETDNSDLPMLVAAEDNIASPHMAYEIDRARREQYGGEDISFADLVKKAAACLQKKGKFFLFAEAGKIDTACADGDLVSAMYEVKALDNAVAEALRFYEKYPNETLIVVLADHETGSLRIGSKGDYSKISGQIASCTRFEKIMRELYQSDAPFSEAMEKVEHYFGLSEEDFDSDEMDSIERKYKKMQQGAETDEFAPFLCKKKAKQANVTFVSSSHSGQPVPVYAIGRGADIFAGMYDNSNIYEKLCSVMALRV